MRVAPEIVLAEVERAELMKLVGSKLTSVRLEQCAGIVLLAAEGLQNKEIAEMLGVGRVQVGRWRAATMTHDYKRNGTTTLFAELNVLDGKVIAEFQQRHRHLKWLKFLRKIDRDILQKVIRENSRLSSKQNATLH